MSGEKCKKCGGTGLQVNHINKNAPVMKCKYCFDGFVYKPKKIKR